MPFAAALHKSLEDRDSEVAAEFSRGDSLEDVLNRHLKAVEEMAGDDLFTCILLLSPDGKRLSYGAAPTVPASYCRASDYIEIGPCSGSCGAAAYFGRPVYSIDIETDPVWGGYRDLALQHGYRSCWSTPIRNSMGSIIGTFAILHRTVGKPTRQEIDAIDMITGHVADAIMWSRDPISSARRSPRGSAKPAPLRLVADNPQAHDPAARLRTLAEKLQTKAAYLDRQADRSKSETAAQDLRDAAELSRKMAANLMSQVGLMRSREPDA
jgi:hypothetical protein